MTVRVRVRGFQSIEDATIEIDGFTVVTGQNNSGKSALMRAIRGAFQNARGSSFIRHGCPKTQVDIEFPKEGKTLHWEKGRGKADKPTYVLDGGDPIHPGQGVPTGVPELGVKPIQAGGREVWPQFAPQFTGQVFLLDQPGSVLAEAVADVERVSKLNDALRMAESDRRAAVTELKVLLENRELQEQDLARFTGLDDLAVSMQGVEATIQQCTRMERALVGLLDLQKRLTKATNQAQFLARVEQIEVPQDEDLDQMLSSLQDLRKLWERLIQVQSVVETLSGVEKVSVPDGGEMSAIRSILGDVKPLRDLRDRLTRSKGQVARLEGIEAVETAPDTNRLEKALTALKLLKELRSRTETAVKRVQNLENELGLEELAVEEVTAELRGLLEGLDTCPMCGKAIDKNEVCDEACVPLPRHD
jgi:exonuclease SbcC